MRNRATAQRRQDEIRESGDRQAGGQAHTRETIIRADCFPSLLPVYSTGMRLYAGSLDVSRAKRNPKPVTKHKATSAASCLLFADQSEPLNQSINQPRRPVPSGRQMGMVRNSYVFMMRTKPHNTNNTFVPGSKSRSQPAQPHEGRICGNKRKTTWFFGGTRRKPQSTIFFRRCMGTSGRQRGF